jgi:hypothetical protein
MRLGTLKQGVTSALIAAGCALAFGSGTALAESACKGLEQRACEKAADCIWVGGYEKKDGKQVSGYCRTKSTGGAAEPKASEATGSKAADKAKASEATGSKAADKAKASEAAGSKAADKVKAGEGAGSKAADKAKQP